MGRKKKESIISYYKGNATEFRDTLLENLNAYRYDNTDYRRRIFEDRLFGLAGTSFILGMLLAVASGFFLGCTVTAVLVVVLLVLAVYAFLKTRSVYKDVLYNQIKHCRRPGIVKTTDGYRLSLQYELAEEAKKVVCWISSSVMGNLRNQGSNNRSPLNFNHELVCKYDNVTKKIPCSVIISEQAPYKLKELVTSLKINEKDKVMYFDDYFDQEIKKELKRLNPDVQLLFAEYVEKNMSLDLFISKLLGLLRLNNEFLFSNQKEIRICINDTDIKTSACSLFG